MATARRFEYIGRTRNTMEGEEMVQTALSVEALLQVLEGAPDAILLTDSTGVLRFVNRQAESMFGYTREELLGRPIEVLVPSALRAGHKAHRQRYAERPTSRPMGLQSSLLAQRKDGATFPVEVSLSPIRTAQGAFVAGAVRDISERKRLEKSALLTSQRLFSAVDSIQTMFALFDAQDQLVLCNSAFRQLFEHVSGPVIERSFHELMEAARNIFAPEALERWAAYHSKPSGVLDLRSEAGLALRIAERTTPEGGRVATIWDVSGDVAREQELKQARALAEAASAAKSSFLSSISHELRTPLNAILGFTQLLARDRREPPTQRQRERLEQVLHSGQYLLRLIEDVLDLSRIESGRLSVSLEPVSVSVVLSEVAASLQPMAAQAGVTVECTSPPELSLMACADRTRLIQVLTIFGTNAIKYGASGGYVRFEAGRVEQSIKLSVTDGGPGIAPKYQDTLFEPFQRAGQETGSVEGTGIGLAISKRLAELMDGRVGFESSLGKGSCFWLELPAVVPSLEAPVVPERPRARPLATVSAMRTVLYVEDNPSNIAVMRDLMQELESVELVAAPTGEQGIDFARTHMPSLVIMDINLPGISGWEAGRRLKQMPETSAIPIVALSAAALVAGGPQPHESPFVRYLTKPVELDELLSTVEELIVAPT